MGQRRRHKRRPSFAKDLLIAGSLLLVLGSAGLRSPEVSLATKVQFVFMILILLLVGTAAWFWKQYQRDQHAQKMLALAADQIDALPPLVFEREYVPALLRKIGYSDVRTTPYNDFGIDLVATKQLCYGIQIKHLARPDQKRVSLKAIQEVVSGVKHRNYRRCEGLMVITNGYFTKAAQELAADCHCQLVDREQLGAWILESKREQNKPPRGKTTGYW